MRLKRQTWGVGGGRGGRMSADQSARAEGERETASLCQGKAGGGRRWRGCKQDEGKLPRVEMKMKRRDRHRGTRNIIQADFNGSNWLKWTKMNTDSCPAQQWWGFYCSLINQDISWSSTRQTSNRTQIFMYSFIMSCLYYHHLKKAQSASNRCLPKGLGSGFPWNPVTLTLPSAWKSASVSNTG